MVAAIRVFAVDVLLERGNLNASSRLGRFWESRDIVTIHRRPEPKRWVRG
jgi:hypothetical protein